MNLDRRIAAAALCCLAAIAAPTPSPATVSITLQWRAPGDDGLIGRATAYSLRYSTSPITAANFANATPVAGVPAPRPAGSLETFTVPGLSPNTGYFFAIKTRDEADNWSALSNVAFVPPLMLDAGDTPLEAAFSTPWPNPAQQSASWSCDLPEAAVVQVEAFDVNGRAVRTVANGMRPAGRGEVRWDLRDDSGRRVHAGLYLVRARLGDRTWTQRLSVIP